MRYINLLALCVFVVAVTLAFTSPVWAGKNKVEVCHVPPGNPENIHTITINENAVDAHLAHGDVLGSCNDNCAAICDDGDACTIDDIGDCEQNGCPLTPVPVDCDDGLTWTEDTCDSNAGCQNTSLCPCWNGDPGLPFPEKTLVSLWLENSPENCNNADECFNFTFGGTDEFSQAECESKVDGEKGPSLSTSASLNSFGTKDCNIGRRGAGSSILRILLDEESFEHCLAEHRAFSDVGPSLNTSCGLPTPEQ